MKMLVLGAAVSGASAARFGRKIAADVLVYDRNPEALRQLEDEGLATHGGDWTSELLDGVDVVVASPGIPEHSAPIQDALRSRIPLWSELELAARHLDCRIVAVTGTNGKTTVTSLIAEMLNTSGIKAIAAGNIGTALTGIVGLPLDVAVVEASSFQLRFIDSFSPDVAVVLNVAEDHLDWHRTFDAYFAAKANIVANAGEHTPLIYDADDEGATRLARASRADLCPVSGSRRPPNGWGVEGGCLVLDGLEIPLGAVPTDDSAFLLDLVAAGTAARAAGARAEAVRQVIESFAPGPHRRTVVGSWGGVTWVDDSKATNPHAASAAVDAFSSVVLIAGGRNKGLDLAPLIQRPGVRSVVAIGEATHDIAASALVPVAEALTMPDAVFAARAVAEPGDTVLLAPGCTSWDMFVSYAERGDAFAAAVRELFKEGG